MPCWKKITLLKHNVMATLNRNGQDAIRCRGTCGRTLATKEVVTQDPVYAHLAHGKTTYYCTDCAASLWL